MMSRGRYDECSLITGGVVHGYMWGVRGVWGALSAYEVVIREGWRKVIVVRMHTSKKKVESCETIVAMKVFHVLSVAGSANDG